MKHDHSAFHAKAAYGQGIYGRDADSRIRQFLPLVRKLAWLYESSCDASLDVDDLMQAGLVALTDCVHRHQRETDDGFAAYVKMRVRGAMIDLLRAQSNRPRSAAGLDRKIARVAGELQRELGRDATLSELAARLNLTVQDVDRALAERGQRTVQIDDAYSDKDAAFADDTPDGEARLLQIEDRDRLAAAIGALPERLQMIVQLHFVEELNLTEIAAILDVSVPRVHQLKGSALAKLRLELAPAD